MHVFYASSETLRDTANILLRNKQNLSPYRWEKYMIPEYLDTQKQITDKNSREILQIIECYVENIIGIY